MPQPQSSLIEYNILFSHYFRLWKKTQIQSSIDPFFTKQDKRESDLLFEGYNKYCLYSFIPSSFKNLGNTCYLSAVLQALFSIPCFVNALDSPDLVATVADIPCTPSQQGL